MNLSNHLKDCREESGLSQDEVARLLTITRQALSGWENGKTEPDTKTLAALAKIYGKSIDELIHGKPEEAPEEQPEALMAEAAEDAPTEPFEIVPEEPSETQKKSLSVKARALLLALAVLLALVIGFAAGWYAHAHVQSHTVNERQFDLSEPHGTLEFFPVEGN